MSHGWSASCRRTAGTITLTALCCIHEHLVQASLRYLVRSGLCTKESQHPLRNCIVAVQPRPGALCALPCCQLTIRSLCRNGIGIDHFPSQSGCGSYSEKQQGVI